MQKPIQTYADVDRVLTPYAAAALETTGQGITVDRTLRLAAYVGNPQTALRVVHIAGTSGKTSTAYYVSALLQQAGKRVGTTVSPHVVSVGERVQIDGEVLGEAVFCKYFDEFMHQIEAWDEVPTYFEIMTVFALHTFARIGVEYAVLETGLGGLHDSTNICQRSDKLCVITDIGYDHMHILGSTLAQIAAQKAGIIAARNHVVMYEQSRVVMTAIRRQVSAVQARLHIVDPPKTRDYRERNFGLAQAVYRTLAARDGLPALSQTQQLAARQAVAPGRLTTYQRGDSQIIIDGAHNPQKIAALRDTLELRAPGRRYAVVLAVKQSKEYPAIIKLLAPLCRRVVATQFAARQDTVVASVEPSLLSEECARYGVPSTEAPDIAAAINRLVAAKEPHILVVGSLYAAAEVLQRE